MSEDQIYQELKRINAKLDRQATLLDGGGEPSKGFIVRIDRIEQKIKAIMWFLATLGVSVIGYMIPSILSAIKKL